MFEVAALFYGVLASFIMASTSRNKREARHNPPIVQLFGWAMMAFSAAMGAMLLGYVAWRLLAGTAG
jgi:flagellar biosynthesis protein FliQ